MKCLVLGGGGFLGSHLCETLLNKGHEVRIFEKENAIRDNVSHFFERIEWVEGDFALFDHFGSLLKGIDVVFHLISTTLPKTSNDDIVYDISSNLIPTLHLLEASRKHGVKKIIFFSSGGTVYGIPNSIPISESHTAEPICSYGIHKLAIEKYLHFYYHNYALDYAVLRISNPYGERQSPFRSQGVMAVFPYKALKREPIEIWGDGSIIRDYIYISDLMEAVIAILSYRGKYKVFNIGSGTGVSLLEVINEIHNIVGFNPEVRFMQPRNIDVPINVLNIERAVRELSWGPRESFTSGLEKTIRHIASKYFRKERNPLDADCR